MNFIPHKAARHSNKPALGMILQQPWARLVAEGVFPVLVRPMPTLTRGRVAIIARGLDTSALVDGRAPDSRSFAQSALIGYVNIFGCASVPRRKVIGELRRLFGKEFTNFYPRHYIPDKNPVFFWFLDSSTVLQRPRKLKLPRSRVWVRLSRSVASYR